MHLRRGGIGVPEANSGRACEFLKREFLINKRHIDADGLVMHEFFKNVPNRFKLAESINTVCNHVDNVREMAYGNNADWRDFNDDVIEDNLSQTKQILRDINAGNYERI